MINQDIGNKIHVCEHWAVYRLVCTSCWVRDTDVHIIVSERHLCAHYVEWETLVCRLCLVRDTWVHILSERHWCAHHSEWETLVCALCWVRDICVHIMLSERHWCAHHSEWETLVCTLCLVRDIDVHMILSERHTCFNRHFPNEPELAGIYWSKGWLRCWWQLDYWSYKSCKAPVKSSAPTNQHPVFFTGQMPSCRPINGVKALKGKYHIPGTCLSQAHLGSSNFVSDH